jgi:hypothetical protein
MLWSQYPIPALLFLHASRAWFPLWYILVCRAPGKLFCGLGFETSWASCNISLRLVGALAYGITTGHPSFSGWRVLFLVEGLPTICMAFVALLFLPDSPDKTRYLTDEEKEVAKARAIRQVGTEGADRIGSLSFEDIAPALLDIKNWITAVSPVCYKYVEYCLTEGTI